jgi:DNA-binding NtrC family response regulator
MDSQKGKFVRELRGRRFELTLNLLWIGGQPDEPPLGWRVDCAETASAATASLSDSRYDAAILAPPVTDDGCTHELLEYLASEYPRVPVVVYDRRASVAEAVRWIRLGAHDVAGPDDDLAALVEAAAEFYASQRNQGDAGCERWRKTLVGASRAIERTAEIIRMVGPRKCTVLISGETGSGKEMVARALHLASPRAHLPMVTVNAAALPENLLEAELFGHVKGAFTGAIQTRVGRFEQAHRSTLFLDEVGDLPLEIQTKLLRFLQERELERVGSSETVCVDVRLIAATHVNLIERVREGKFREDLYYRLNVVPVTTPPLRERVADIPMLAAHFLEKICGQEEIPRRRLTPEALARLRSHAWPGNVRQLENVVERAVAMSGARLWLLPSDFPSIGPAPHPAVNPVRGAGEAAGLLAVPESGLDYDATVGSIERQILEDAMRKSRGNKTAAAGMLGLKRTTLAAKLRSLRAAAG